MPVIQNRHAEIGHTAADGDPAETYARATAPRDMVDESGEDSFPCSDPPSWTLGRSAVAHVVVEDERNLRDEPARNREVEVTTLSEIRSGEVRGFTVEGREIALCSVGEQVHALSGTCPYHPTSLGGASLDGEMLTCPWSGARFDVITGESVFLRSARPLATYRTAVRNGRVFVQVPLDPVRSALSRWMGA